MDLTGRLRAALTAAMRARDRTAVAALRSALAALDNAAAVPAGPAAAGPGTADVAGAVLGVGAGEVPRRAVPAAEAAALLRAEVTEREDAAAGYERSGHPERAARLRAEAAALTAVLAAD